MKKRHKFLIKRLKEAESAVDHCKQLGLDKNILKLEYKYSFCKVVSKKENIDVKEAGDNEKNREGKEKKFTFESICFSFPSSLIF